MKITTHESPREFTVGYGPPVTMKDCAQIALESDEQVTLTTPGGAEYDVARKSWGFYATPSINGRLCRFGLRSVLVCNRDGRFFVLLVEDGKDDCFAQYVDEEGLEICGWLDNDTLPVVAETLQRTRVNS